MAALGVIFVPPLHSSLHSPQKEPVPLYTVTYGKWHQAKPREVCYSSPGLSWSERNAIACETLWPSARAGHAAVLDDHGGMWLHGGFTAYFPYITTGESDEPDGRITAWSTIKTVMAMYAY